MPPERIHIAEPPPPRCSGCFSPPTEDRLPFVDLGGAWDGPSIPALEGTVGVIAHHIDDLILCRECVATAAKLLGLEDVAKVRRVLDERNADVERLQGQLAAMQDRLDASEAARKAEDELMRFAPPPARSRQPRAKATA